MVELDLKSIPIKKIEVFMYHTQAKHKKKWLSEHRANLEKRMKFIFDDKKIEFDIIGRIGMVKSTNHRFRVITIFKKI